MARTATATKERPQAETQRPIAQSAPQGNLPAATNDKPKHPLVAFKDYMDQRMGEVALALPPQISPDRFARVALTALQRKPDLLKCTRQSLFNACMLAAQDGLLPDGREGAIAPYGESEGGKRVAEIATWMPMIEGLRKKARNSGEISNWEVHVVRAKDHFEVILGDNPRIDHKPYFGPEDAGDIVGAYSIAWLKDGTISRDAMTIRDIKKIEAKSKASKGPWKDTTFFPEMCKKTVARRHYKQLPHSSDLDEMIRRDDEAFGFEDRSAEQIEARQQRRVASTTAAFDEFAKGPVIEHDGELSGSQYEPEPDNGLDGEFEDDAPAQQQAKPDAAPSRQDQQEEQSGEGERDISKGDEVHRGDADDDGQSDGGPAEVAKDGASQAPSWPADKKPKTEEDYRQYAAATIAGQTDAAAIAAWFKSPEQRNLRNSCGVTKEGFDAVKAQAQDRITALNKA